MPKSKSNSINDFLVWVDKYRPKSSKTMQNFLGEIYLLLSQENFIDKTNSDNTAVLNNSIKYALDRNKIHPKRLRDTAKEYFRIYNEYKKEQDAKNTAPENSSNNIATTEKTSPSVHTNKNENTVVFDQIESYTNTRPVSLQYFIKKYSVLNWSELYIQIVKCLADDYSFEMNVFKTRGRYGIADKAHSPRMVRPQMIKDDLYIDTNRSSTEIVKNIKLLLDSCGVNYNNITIKYIYKDVVTKTPEYLSQPASYVPTDYTTFKVVSFRQRVYYSHIYPISITYFGKEYFCNSWSDLYIQSIRCLYEDYKDILDEYKSQNKYGFRSNISLYTNQLLRPRKVVDDFYVETNYSANDIIKHIKRNLDLCRVEYENVIIKYTNKKDYIRPNNSSPFPTTPQRSFNSTSETPKNIPAPPKKIKVEVHEVTAHLENTNQSVINLKLYRKILTEKFQHGFKPSFININKFKDYYQEESGKPLEYNEDKIKNIIRNCGIEYNGVVYVPQTMLNEEMKNKLFNYIDKTFDSGTSMIYFEALYDKFSDEFLDSKIRDTNMLKEYIKYTTGDKYIICGEYFAKERFANADPVDEIRKCLKENFTPMKVEDICKKLPNIPESKIKVILGSSLEFVNNGKSYYFDADSLDLTDKELHDISNLIENEIESSGYITGNELFGMIQKYYPDIYENNSIFSKLGWRKALKYKLGNKFNFKGNVICEKYKNLTMSDLYELYGKNHKEFSLDDITQFVENTGSNIIYFESLYKYSARISREKFVSKEYIEYNVAETDKTLERFCTGDYVPIQEIQNFGIFPSASEPWNIFLLENYVAYHSEEFRLIHACFAQTSTVGAVVKRNSGINDLDELIPRVLADSNISLNKKDALDYLCEKGYFLQRKYNKFEQARLEAQALRNRRKDN